jgi:hypothetical protein
MQTDSKTYDRVFSYSFAKIYNLYLIKVERKGRTKKDLDAVLCWLTGHTSKSLSQAVKSDCTLKEFFKEAPAFQKKAKLITGLICGVRVEEIEHPLMRKIRYMDKVVDEVAKGKSIDSIMRK